MNIRNLTWKNIKKEFISKGHIKWYSICLVLIVLLVSVTSTRLFIKFKDYNIPLAKTTEKSNIDSVPMSKGQQIQQIHLQEKRLDLKQKKKEMFYSDVRFYIEMILLILGSGAAYHGRQLQKNYFSISKRRYSR